MSFDRGKFGSSWCRGPGVAPNRGETVEYDGSLTEYHGRYIVEDMYPDDGRGALCLYTLRSVDRHDAWGEPMRLRSVGRSHVSNLVHYRRLPSLKSLPLGTD